MINFFRNLRLDIKIALLGIGIGLITAVTLVSLAVWQSGQYNRLAQHEVDELIDADLDHITEGVYHLVKTENEAVGEQLNYSLRVARHILADAGNIGFSEETVFWTATNQFTNKKTKIQIPRMTINGRWLGQNTDPAIKTPLVDDITGLIGETATLFQRMNEKGDMIRVATTVKDAQGRRAIGTFIPAVGPDGKPNPVVATILRGNTYHGRAFVVNAWYLTAYEPIRNKAGHLIGMLYVGVRQKAVEMRIRQAIVQTKVGKTGYVYVLAGKGEDRGRYIISQSGERDGEDIWENQDSEGGYVIQMIIGKATALKPGEMTTVRYKWQNPGESFPRWKIARIAYYEPWDWVIGTSVYEDELQSYRAVLSSGRMKMTAVMGLAGLMLMVIIGLSGIFFAWTIMRPVGQLTRAAEVIMKGNLNQTVPINSQDEIGMLARTFNTMTERLRQTMAGLQKSETKYRTLVETTRDLIFIVDTEGRLTFANPRLEALTGLSFHELQCKPFTDILHPEFRERETSRFEKGVGGKVIAPYEVLVIDRAGKETPVEILSATLFDPDGRPVGRFGVGRDVTERRKAADALHASEQKLKGQLLFMEALLSAMPIPVFYKDADLRYLGCNEAYSEYMGISAEELQGKTARSLWPHELAEMYDLKDRELIEQRGAQTYEFKVQNKDGDIRDVIFRKSVFLNEDGSVGGIIGAHFDISERKQAEEMLRQSELNYRSVIENIQDVIYRSDAKGRLVMASPSILNLLGYDSIDECLGKPIADVFYYEPEKRAEFLRAIQDQGSVANYEVVLKRKDGSPVIVETNSHFYFDEKGDRAGVEGTFRDITSRKQDEEIRRKLENQLIQSQKMEAIGTLAGGIAHDFNNILAGIMGYTELNKAMVVDRPKVYAGMEQVLKAAGRAKDLVRQILTFSRKTEHEKKPVMLAPIVREVVKFMRASLPTTIEIKQTIDVTSDVVWADPTQMHQVLMNLCTNAWHAMKDGGGILEIVLRDTGIDEINHLDLKLLKSGRYLELSVRDTGRGISRENIDKIFDPYFTTKKIGDGTGLGLAVVHGIVKEYGGEITVYSESGRGALFTIYLPLMDVQTREIENTQEAIPQGKGETILFIDDEQMVADMNKELLGSLGYKVVKETNPAAAVDIFRKDVKAFDLIITDKTMPLLTGYDVVREIRNLRPDIPVILCSGFQDKEDTEKIKAHGINRLLLKPVSASLMAQTIRQVLDHPDN